MFKKVSGGFFILIGGILLLSVIDDFGFIRLFLSLYCIFMGYLLFTNQIPKEKPKPVIKPIDPKINSEILESALKNIYFRVAGISKKNDEGKDIQKLIRKLVVDEIEQFDYSYDGMTNKEILEFGEDVYETYIEGDYEITFVPEPNNPYDPKAIKVIHDSIGHIGYVPKDMTARVRNVLSKDHTIKWNLIGGKMKYVDYDDYSIEGNVKIKTLTYGIAIDIYY